MADNNIPTLTLDPNGASSAAPTMPSFSTGGAVAMAQAQMNESGMATAPKKEVEPVVVDENMLNDEEKAIVNDFASKIDITNTNQVLMYGSSAQKNIADFSEGALNAVRTQDLGEIGETLANLVVQIKTCQEPEKKGIGGFFQKKKNEFEALKANYSKAETNVDKIAEVLELLKDECFVEQAPRTDGRVHSCMIGPPRVKKGGGKPSISVSSAPAPAVAKDAPVAQSGDPLPPNGIHITVG